MLLIKKLTSRCLNNFDGFVDAVNWPAGSCSMKNCNLADFELVVIVLSCHLVLFFVRLKIVAF